MNLRLRLQRLEQDILPDTAMPRVVSGCAFSEAEAIEIEARLKLANPGAMVLMRHYVRPGFDGWPTLQAQAEASKRVHE